MLGLSDKWCRLPESNWRPTDYKSVALPTELSRHTKLCAINVLTSEGLSWHRIFVSKILGNKYSKYGLNKWCLDPESNQGHEDFQSSALPTELSRHNNNLIDCPVHCLLGCALKTGRIKLFFVYPVNPFF